MGKAPTKADVAEKQEPTGEATSAYERLRPFAGIVASGGLQLSTQTGKHFREGLQRKLAGESKRD